MMYSKEHIFLPSPLLRWPFAAVLFSLAWLCTSVMVGQNKPWCGLEKMKGGLEINAGLGYQTRYLSSIEYDHLDDLLTEGGAALTLSYADLKAKWLCGMGNTHVFSSWTMSYALGKSKKIELGAGRRRMHHYFLSNGYNNIYTNSRQSYWESWESRQSYWQFEAGYRLHRLCRADIVWLPVKHFFDGLVYREYGSLQLRIAFVLEQNVIDHRK